MSLLGSLFVKRAAGQAIPPLLNGPHLAAQPPLTGAAVPNTPPIQRPLPSVFPQRPPTSGIKATGLPGTPGHAATNVIDQLGGLDPSGRTVDGNNAAGISKNPIKMG